MPFGSVRRALCMAAALLWAGFPGSLKAQSPTIPFPLPGIIISYVSEVPWPVEPGQIEPLERWAKKLSADWGAPPPGGGVRLNNLRGETSFAEQRKSALVPIPRAHVFVMHAFEALEHEKSTNLEALLTPAINGKADMTEFVMLRHRPPAGQASSFTFRDLAGQTVLVDRSGCGDLVYRWLETEIKPETGASNRDTIADFHSARSSSEAILAVYFGEAYACVVTRESSAEVFRTNPKGFVDSLEEVRSSPAFLKHIIASRLDLPPAQRTDILHSAAAVRMDYGGIWALAVPSDADKRSVTALNKRWKELQGSQADPATAPGTASAPPKSADSGTARQTAANPQERRHP